jgi:hypothetical protein
MVIQLPYNTTEFKLVENRRFMKGLGTQLSDSVRNDSKYSVRLTHSTVVKM